MKRTWMVVYLLAMVHYWSTLCSKYSYEKIITLTEVGKCSANKDLPISYTYLNITNLGKGRVSWDSQAVVSRPVIVHHATIRVERCRDGGTDCEHFLKFKVPGTCSSINNKDSYWMFIIANFDPVIRCPIRTGTYTQRNATVDSSTALKFISSDDKFVWRFVFAFQDEDDHMVGCCTGSVKVTQLRQQIRSNKTRSSPTNRVPVSS